MGLKFEEELVDIKLNIKLNKEKEEMRYLPANGCYGSVPGRRSYWKHGHAWNWFPVSEAS